MSIAVLSILAAAMSAPAPALATRYPPEQLAEVREEIAALEHELDIGHPGWRDRRPFHAAPDNLKGWIKLRLKRLDLLHDGHADWGVLLSRSGTAILAVAVPPAVGAGEVYDQPISVSIYAEQARRSATDVEEAMQALRRAGRRVTRRALASALAVA